MVRIAASLLAAATPRQAPLDGRWRAVLDLAGGALPFELSVSRENSRLVAAICNGPKCADQAVVTRRGDSVVFDIADYGATWPTVEDPDKTLKSTYRVAGRPQTYFIGGDGILRSIQIGEVGAADFDRQYAKIAP